MQWTDFLQLQIREEEYVRGKYEYAASRVRDPDLKKVFRQLAYEEGSHIAIIRDFYEKLKAKKRKP